MVTGGLAERSNSPKPFFPIEYSVQMQSEDDYCIDPGLIEKALLAAEESTRSG